MRRGLPAAQAAYLRLAGSAPGDAELRRRLAALSGVDHWASLRALARRDGAAVPVQERVAAAGVQPPDDVAAAMRAEAQVAAFHAARLERRLQEALAVLAAAGVRPLLLKGAGLAYSAHGRFAARPMGDLDLLLAPAELPTAAAALQAAGWAPGTPDARYEAHQHDVPLTAPGGDAVVELHHELFPSGHPFDFAAATVRQRAREVHTGGGPVVVPEPADQLLHACLHFAWSHELRWGSWRAFADVAALLRGGLAAPTAWPALAERARSARGATAVYWTLRLAAEVGGAPVPAALLAALAPPLGAARRRRLAGHYAQQLLPGAARVPSVAVGRLLWSQGMQPSASGHGRVRPWSHGGMTTAPAAGDPATARRSAGAGWGRRATRQLGALPAWLHWWRATR